MTKVYFVTQEGDVPFESATDEQMESCERVVCNKKGVVINRINPRDFNRIEQELEQRRQELAKVLCCC